MASSSSAMDLVSLVQRMGDYSNVKLLAQGGTGAAFKVRCTDYSQRALKLALNNGDDELQDFLAEDGELRSF